MNRYLRNIILLLFEIIFLWTTVLIFGFQDKFINYTTKCYDFKNIYYLGIALSFVICGYIINLKYSAAIRKFLDKYHKIIVLISLIVLLGWQLFACYGSYFNSGWDPGTILNASIGVFKNKSELINLAYFSYFPNNLMIVWLFSHIYKLAQFFGYLNFEYSVVFFQCIIDVVVLWLVYKIVINYTHNYKVAMLSYFLAYFFVGISPWYIVTYSDAVGILFPVGIIRLYQIQKNDLSNLKRIIIQMLIGFVSILGYHIKPQIFILFIAIVLFEFCAIFNNNFRINLKSFVSKLISFLIGIALFSLVYNIYIVPSLHLQLNVESKIGWQHFVMMGLNEENDGAFLASDYSISFNIKTINERNKDNLREAENRIKHYGFGGLINHLNRKQFVNYGDGTFAWGAEGNFFAGDPKWAHNSSSNFVRSFIKPEGKNYRFFLSSKQILWNLILFFLLFVFLFFYKGGIDESLSLIMIISIIGLTLFELIFEARSRYLFCYAPIYVILCIQGMQGLHKTFKNKFH